MSSIDNQTGAHTQHMERVWRSVKVNVWGSGGIVQGSYWKTTSYALKGVSGWQKQSNGPSGWSLQNMQWLRCRESWLLSTGEYTASQTLRHADTQTHTTHTIVEYFIFLWAYVSIFWLLPPWLAYIRLIANAFFLILRIRIWNVWKNICLLVLEKWLIDATL